MGRSVVAAASQLLKMVIKASPSDGDAQTIRGRCQDGGLRVGDIASPAQWMRMSPVG